VIRHGYSKGRCSVNWKFFYRLARLLLISRRHREVRSSVVFVFTNTFGLLSFSFAVTSILIAIGLAGIHLPIPDPLARLAVTILF